MPRRVSIRTNWAGNYAYTASRLHFPKTIDQIQELVHRNKKLKVLGTRHSFNDIADSTGEHISLKYFDRILGLDRKRNTVTIDAGLTYGQLCQYLNEKGYALSNLASLPHISVAGACATATHGSGDHNGNLATAVSAIEIVDGSGKLIFLSREKNKKDFEGAIVNLGGLGVVTKLTLDIISAFEMRQDVYENMQFEQLEDHFDEITSSAYSISFFTDWNTAKFNQVWFKCRVEDTFSFNLKLKLFGATLATNQKHPVGTLDAENCTKQMGIHGSWHERLPHFRMDFTPSSGEELQTEYLIPRKNATAALLEISKLSKHVAPLLQISEVRTVAEDNLWMSPSYKTPCVGVHFTWKKDWNAVKKLLPIIEKQLEPFDARPHWGKLFTMSPSRLKSLYKKLPSFQQLLRSYDPQGKFRNAFLDKYIFGVS